MKSRAVRRVVTTMAVTVVGLCSGFSQSTQSSAAPSSETNVKPLLLERNEGELRTRRIHTDNSAPASSQFMAARSARKTTALSVSWWAQRRLPQERPYPSIGTWPKMKSS